MLLKGRNFILTLLALLFAGSVGAHHIVGDDVDLQVPALEFDAVIETVEWINPHVVIHVTTANDYGVSQRWLLQADSPNALLRRGINRRSLSLGLKVEVKAYPSLTNVCNNDCYGYGLELTTSTGDRLLLNGTLADMLN